MTEGEKTYFFRTFKEKMTIGQFYITAKVLKIPFKTRSFVVNLIKSTSYLSCWVEYHFQPLAKKTKTYLWSSDDIIQKYDKMGPLELGTIIFAFDVVSLYKNIKTEHVLTVISAYLRKKF